MSGLRAGLLLALACGGRAWAQETGGQAFAPTETVASSTAAAVDASTPTAPAAEPAPAPEERTIPKSRVIVHKDAADWEPVSVVLRPGFGPGRVSFERRVRTVRGAYRGQPSAAKAAARLYPFKDDLMLVVSIYPAALRPRRMHLEARFLIQEGYLEEAKLSAVSVVGGQYSPADEKEDSFTLLARGVDIIEEGPGSAHIELSVIDPGPGREAFNAGRVTHASFGDSELGFVNFAWSLKGVAGVKPVRAKRPFRPAKPAPKADPAPQETEAAPSDAPAPAPEAQP